MKHLARAIFLIVGLTLPAPGFPQSQAQSPETAKRELPNRLTTAPSLEQQRTLFSVVRETLPEDDPKVIRWLRDNADYLAPSFLFELSRRLMAIDEADAMEWFTVARMRAQYDALRCADRSSRKGIARLPQIAIEVALYGQSHREEYGRAGLKALVRPHLFTDDVSPIWICIHGLGVIRAVQENKALKKEQWLVPESEWLSIKRKIVAGAETYFRQQTVPQDDPIPSSRLKFAVHTPQGQLKIENFAWLNDDELVFGVNNGSKESRKEIDLYFWQPGSDETPRNIALGTYFWCAGRGTVMYETGQIALEDDVFEYSYRIGPIGDFTEQRLRVKGRPIRPEQVQDWGVRWSRAENPYLRSRFTCQWVKNKRLSEQYHSRWLPLIGRDGFLTFRFDSWKLIGEQSSVRYASNPEKDSEPLPIQWIPVLPKCVNYYDFKNGYFLSPCGIGNKHIRELKVQSCIPYWWLKKVGERMEVEEFCPPADSVTKNNPIKFPSKAGMLRLISERETFHGAKIGGVYLTTQNGTVTKIFDAWINDAQMSPGGCLLALRHGPGNNFNKLGLSVIDVCSVLPLATQ